jgi:hypothetical protein
MSTAAQFLGHASVVTTQNYSSAKDVDLARQRMVVAGKRRYFGFPHPRNAWDMRLGQSLAIDRDFFCTEIATPRFVKPVGWMSERHADIIVRPVPGEEAFVAAARAAYRAASKSERQRFRSLVMATTT